MAQTVKGCDCKKSFLQSQTSEVIGQKKTKIYGDCLFLNYSFPDFLQARLKKLKKQNKYNPFLHYCC